MTGRCRSAAPAARSHSWGPRLAMLLALGGGSLAAVAAAQSGPGGPGGPEMYCPPQPPRVSWWDRPLLVGITPPVLPQDTFVRLEYLHWNIERPGDVPLGGPSLTINPTAGFNRDTFIPISPINPTLGNVLSPAYLPTLRDVQLTSNSGMRGTFGIPLPNDMMFEANAFAVAQADQDELFSPVPLTFFAPTFQFLPGTNFLSQVPVNTVTVDGVPGLLTIPFNNGLQTSYTSDLWGAGGRFILDAVAPPGEGFKMRPLVGFRYLRLRESMDQQGSNVTTIPNPLDPTDPTLPPVTSSNNSEIFAETENNIYAAELGLRAELEHRWFTVGIQPAVALGGNDSRTRVMSSQFLRASDLPTEEFLKNSTFSPILEANAFARVNVNDHLKLHLGYDAMLLTRVLRASRAVDYNVRTDTTDPTGPLLRSDIGARREYDRVGIYGFNVGAEFTY